MASDNHQDYDTFQTSLSSLTLSNPGQRTRSFEDPTIDTGPLDRLQTEALENSENLEGRESGRNSKRSPRNIATVFPEGNYTGMVNHSGKPSGNGTMRFNDGSVYNGEWQNSVMFGVGVCTYADGLTKYDGAWENGMPHGQGYFIYSNNDRYDGSWINGCMEGRGVYTFQNSEKYDGGWKENKHHGNGKFTYESGNIYDGQWRYGKREGHGIFKYANGDEFAGEYCNDRKEGLGVYRWANEELDIKAYSKDLPSEGVRFGSDRRKAWKVRINGSCVVTSLRSAKSFRENTCMFSPFLAHYLDKNY